MGSSKTANAIMVRHNYLERGQRVLMLKPRVDNRDGETMIASRRDRKSTRLNSSHSGESRMPSSA